MPVLQTEQNGCIEKKGRIVRDGGGVGYWEGEGWSPLPQPLSRKGRGEQTPKAYEQCS